MLYPHQLELKNKVKESFVKGNKFPCVQAPTGFGKSYIIGSITQSVLEKGAKRVAIFVDSLTLIDQLIDTLENTFGLDAGVIQGFNERYDKLKPVQIITPQTISNRFKTDRQYQNYWVDFAIIDEAHVQYESYKTMREHWKCKGIGLTATPYAKGMGLYYDDLVKSEPMGDLIKSGFLSEYQLFSHPVADLKGLKTGSNGDLVGSDERYTPEVMGDIYNIWKEKTYMEKSIGFAPNIAKCEAYAEMFRERGVSSQAIHSKLSDTRCKQLIDDFKSGSIVVLWSVAKLVKGFDVPEITTLLDAQPTRSVTRHVQKWGRLLRPSEGKEYGTVLDFAGNYRRMGFLEDISIDNLDDGTKGDNPDRVNPPQDSYRCPKCGHEHKKQFKKCHSCDHEKEDYSEKVEPDRTESNDGELVKIKKGDSYGTSQQQEILSGLVHHFIERNKSIQDKNNDIIHKNKKRISEGKKPLKQKEKPLWKNGWVNQTFNEIVGHYPPYTLNVTPSHNDVVESRLKYMRIKRAKSRYR